MENKLHRLSSALLAFVLVLSFCLPARAHDVPDENRLGSIGVAMREGTNIVAGGTLSIYMVGKVVENDGDYSFEPAGAFAGCGESFATLENAAELAARLSNYAKKNSITDFVTKNIDKNGNVTFERLELGLYLVVQNTPARGYSAVSPFLVSVPYMENGEYIYDVNATSKLALKREPEPVPPRTPEPPDETLVQTGQLWWPVPLLACTGMLMIAIGMRLKRNAFATETTNES